MMTQRVMFLASVLLALATMGVEGAFGQEYVLIGWNDLGMHCSNKDFSKIAVLPPYNNVTAQLIHRVPGKLPEIVTQGYVVEYSVPGNTYSVGKTNFWTYAQTLFGLAAPLPDNIGLAGKGLNGTMDVKGTEFTAVGIPVTPYQDSNLVSENPYQLIHLVAKANGSSTILASTDVVIPVSNEIGCVQSGCHASEQAILNEHESVSGFNKQGPVLCASCHASNALGTTGRSDARPLSYRIHRAHASVAGPGNSITTCYKCHPGPKTQCLRDVMSTTIAKPMICSNCHGTLDTLANSISQGRRPWLDEPQCGNTQCHGSNYAEQAGTLYRNSFGHGGVACEACHGSPHAILPSREPNDNLQTIRLQGYAGALRTCSVCHVDDPGGVGPHGLSVLSAVNVSAGNPASYSLSQNYPNPFNPAATIRFSVPYPSQVRLSVYNVLGEEVARLVDGQLISGSYAVRWDGTGKPSGVYIYSITAAPVSLAGRPGFTLSKKMLLIR